MTKAVSLFSIVVLAVIGSSVVYAEPSHEVTLTQLVERGIPNLRDRVGDEETVDLNVYFVGFPAELDDELEQAVAARLRGLGIADTKPWWIPRMAQFGEADFDTAPAPASLAAEFTPPDGLIRYEGGSLAKVTDPNSGATMWVPNREINESVDDWHHNADVVYYVEHDGAYTGVGWRIGDLTFSHLSAATLADLYPVLQATQIAYESRNPRQTFQLYSYNALMGWLDDNTEIEGAAGRCNPRVPQPAAAGAGAVHLLR